MSGSNFRIKLRESKEARKAREELERRILCQADNHYHSLSSWWSKKNQNEEQFNSLYKIYHQTFSRLYLNLSGRAIKLYLFFRLVLLLLFPRQVELGWDNSCISYYEIWFEFKLKTSPKFYTIQHIIFPVKYDLFYVQYCPFNIWKIYYSKAHFLHSMGGGSGHITYIGLRASLPLKKLCGSLFV